MSWGSFPQAFVNTDGLVRLMQSAGKHRLGALKVYLALTVLVDFKTRSIAVSVKRLQKLTGLSKPIVLRSIAELERSTVLSVDRSAYRSTYVLLDRSADDAIFAKVPKAKIEGTLSKLPNRGSAGDAALALYIVLLARRAKRSAKTIPISHERLRLLCAIRPEHVRSGLDVLVNHRLVHVGQVVVNPAGGHPLNDYTLLGRFGEEYSGLPAASSADDLLF